MMRQYSPQRFRYEQVNGSACAYRVGTVCVGSIFRYASRRSAPSRKCIVRAWFTRHYPFRDATGRWKDLYLLQGGHLALVEDLTTGKLFRLADHHILRAISDEE